MIGILSRKEYNTDGLSSWVTVWGYMEKLAVLESRRKAVERLNLLTPCSWTFSLYKHRNECLWAKLPTLVALTYARTGS